MPRIRLLRLDGPEGAGRGPALAAHVRRLQAGGPVLFVTADRPAGSWAREWAAAGVDVERLFVVDAVSAMNGTRPAPGPGHATFLPSPAMLEMMALRIEQVIRRHGPVHAVVLDSLDALALYNGLAGVQAFVHYLANRLRGAGVAGDLVVHGGPEAAALRGCLAAFVDGEGAPGATLEVAP